MKLNEAKQQFISSWGAFGTHWGINRTMAQIHALLLWGLVERIILTGERKEFFIAEKDIWKVVKQIVKERKKRELEPMLLLLDKLENVEADKKDKKVKTFVETVSGIKKLAQQADKTLDVMIRAEENWFIGNLVKLMK